VKPAEKTTVCRVLLSFKTYMFLVMVLMSWTSNWNFQEHSSKRRSAHHHHLAISGIGSTSSANPAPSPSGDTDPHPFPLLAKLPHELRLNLKILTHTYLLQMQDAYHMCDLNDMASRVCAFGQSVDKIHLCWCDVGVRILPTG
jgi:hypothetical protein